MSTTVIKCTLGMPGSGKSYSRVRWLLDTYLPEEFGIVYTNLPLQIDQIVSYLVKKGYCEETLRSRIVVIPDEVLRAWKSMDDKGLPPKNPDYKGKEQGSDIDYANIDYEFLGPWQYFQNVDLSGAHIMIDEIQKFVDNRSSAKVKKMWGNWLSTIRHEGCTIEFMTQTALRLPSEIKSISESTIEIVPNSEERFPLLPIKNYDYYQLAKKFLREDFKSSTCTEWGVAENSKKKVLWRKKYRFNPFFFKFYDSYNNEEKGGSGKRKKEEWEKYNHIQLLGWFLKRNFLSVVLIFVYCYLGFMLLFGNGFNRVLELWRGMQKDNIVELQAQEKGMTVDEYKKHLFKEEIKEEMKIVYESKIENLESAIKEQGVTMANNTQKTVIDRSKALQKPIKKVIKLTFLSPENDYCILSDNKTYRIGDKLDDKTLVRIDFVTRRVFFDDETVLTY